MENPIILLQKATQEMIEAAQRLELATLAFQQVKDMRLLYTIEEAEKAFGFRRSDFRKRIVLPIQGSGGSAPNRYHYDDLIVLAQKLRRVPIPTMTKKHK